MISIIPIGVCIFYLFSRKKHRRMPLIVSIVSLLLIFSGQLYIALGNSQFLYTSELKETIIATEKHRKDSEDNYLTNEKNKVYIKTNNYVRYFYLLEYDTEYVNTEDVSKIEIYENTFKNKLLYIAFDIPNKLIIYDVNTEPLSHITYIEALIN